MAELKPSQADVLREIINEKIKEQFDWSNNQKKRELKAEILEKHPKLFSKDTLNSNFYRILNSCLTKNKKDPRSYGLKSKPPKLNTSSDDMDSKIAPEPQDGSVTPKLDEKTQDNKSDQKSESSSQKEEPKEDKNWENFDEETVGAAFQALLIPIRMAYPELESLTEQEKKSLGKLWLPAFKKYLSEHWALIGLPLLATVAMIAPKISKARKAKKDKKSDKQKVDDLTCPYCNELFDKSEIKNHQENCEKKK